MTDRTFVAEEVFGERLVDNAYRPAAFHIRLVDRAPTHQRNAQGVEVSRTDQRPVRAHLVFRAPDAAIDGNMVAFVARKQPVVRYRGIAHARNGLQSVANALAQRGHGGLRVTGRRGVDARDHQMLAVDSQIYAEPVVQASHEERRADA